MRAHGPLLSSCVTLALLATPRCPAQSPPAEARAMDLRREALEAHRRGDHARALELLTRALSHAPSGSLHGVIVRELVDLAGDAPDLARLADALDHAEVCVREAPAEPPTPARDTILAWCREQVALHAGRFGRVVVEPASTVAGLRVAVGGRPLVAPQPGVAHVAPGRVVVEATAPGYAPFRREVTVARGASVTLRVALARPPAPARAVGPVGLVVGGVGAASWIASGVLWLVAGRRCGEHPTMPDGACYVATQQDVDDVTALDTATTVTLVAGAGLVAVGTVLLFALRPSAAPPPRLTITAGVGAVGVAGRF